MLDCNILQDIFFISHEVVSFDCLLFVCRYLDSIERALSAGEVVLIENLEETVDPVLGPLLGRETIKKGR